jgi:hypothetical protein
MLVNPDGDVTISNDGATILQKMEVEHQVQYPLPLDEPRAKVDNPVIGPCKVELPLISEPDNPVMGPCKVVFPLILSEHNPVRYRGSIRALCHDKANDRPIQGTVSKPKVTESRGFRSIVRAACHHLIRRNRRGSYRSPHVP